MRALAAPSQRLNPEAATAALTPARRGGRLNFEQASMTSPRPLYVVTGVSRLTGQRERITPPCFHATASAICDREMRRPARKRVYLRLKIEAVGSGLFDQFNV